MTHNTLVLTEKFCALRGGSMTRRKFLSVGANRDVQRTNLLCGRRSPDTVLGGLCLRQLGQGQGRDQQEKLTPFHCVCSHRRRSATEAPYCRLQVCGNLCRPAYSSISQPRLAWVA